MKSFFIKCKSAFCLAKIKTKMFFSELFFKMRYLVNTKFLQVLGVKIYAARFLSSSLYWKHLYISAGTL